jgi:hypothetical protein
LVPIGVGQTGYCNSDDNDCTEESAKPKSHRSILSSLTAASASFGFAAQDAGHGNAKISSRHVAHVLSARSAAQAKH